MQEGAGCSQPPPGNGAPVWPQGHGPSDETRCQAVGARQLLLGAEDGVCSSCEPTPAWNSGRGGKLNLLDAWKEGLSFRHVAARHRDPERGDVHFLWVYGFSQGWAFWCEHQRFGVEMEAGALAEGSLPLAASARPLQWVLSGVESGQAGLMGFP